MMYQSTVKFCADIYTKRDLLLSLAKRDFRSTYLGSMLGITWVFVEPVIYMFVMWFFFTKAMKIKMSGDYNYAAWLMCAMYSWNYFATVLGASVGNFRSYSYLLRQPGFNMALLPIVTIMTATFLHAIFLILLVIFLLCTGTTPTFYWLQSIYYYACLTLLLLGISWFTSSVALFIPDVRNIVGVVTQLGFWVSPIFWDLKTCPEKFRIMLKLNPLTYILEGYRKSFLYGEPFWTDRFGTITFWLFTVAVLVIGSVTYHRLRPHFGDML